MRSQNIQKLSWLLLCALTFSTLSAHAAAPAHGKQRLRELVVYPSMDVNFTLAWNFNGCLWQIGSTADLQADIALLEAQVKNHPEDIQSWLRLSYFRSLNHQTDEARAGFEKAERLCRDKLANRPKDGLLLTQLAKTLDELGKDAEAESSYRQAVLVSSNEWRTWMGLAAFLEGRAYATLMPAELRGMLGPFAKPPQKVLDYQPSEDALKEAKSLAREAAQSLVRAQALATNDHNALMEEAAFEQAAALTDFWLNYFQQGKSWNENAWHATFPSQKTADAVRKAADLTPGDCRLIGTAVYMNWACWLVASGSKDYNPAQMPEAVARIVHEGMARLETLSNDSDNKTACNALLTIVTLKLLMKGSPADAAELARKATRLDPTQEQAWDLWLGASFMDDAPMDRLTMICESRLKQKNSARNHLILAKILAKNSKWTDADTHAQEALKLEPDNIVAQLMKIALIIRQSTDDASLNKALALFGSFKEYLKNAPDSQERRTRWREGWLNYAIAETLYTGEDYRKQARATVDDVLKNFPDDEDAKKIREALD